MFSLITPTGEIEELHAVHAGLRRPGWFPNGAGPSGTGRCTHRAGALAHNGGLGANWKARRAFWANRALRKYTRFEPISCVRSDTYASCWKRSPREVANAQIHVLGAGHFALDAAADEIAGLIEAFMVSETPDLCCYS